MTAPPDVHDVRRIVAIANPALRNLEITYCYSRLAAAFAARTGQGANWCSYATWASRQAGRTIRGEDLVERLGPRLRKGRELLHPVRSLWRWLLRKGLFEPRSKLGRLTAQLHTPFDAFELASDAAARGNRKVFEEIGFEFARYLHEVPADAPPDSPELRRFVDGLRPGEPPEGQRYLRQAFARYERQRFEDVPKGRAELLVLANLEVGLHEQTRLQPEIREAVDAAYATKQDLGERWLAVLFPWAARRRLVRRPMGAALGMLASGAQRTASELAREVITESLLVLSVPGRVLALGAHLDDPFPDDLREVGNADLAELLARYEPVPPAVDDCGATDWSVLEQRMHFISHLFRCFHARAELAEPPFTPEQVEDLRRGRVPDGAL
jgi:hypothetical protein